MPVVTSVFYKALTEILQSKQQWNGGVCRQGYDKSLSREDQYKRNGEGREMVNYNPVVLRD